MDGGDFIRRMEAGGDVARAAFGDLYRFFRPRMTRFLRARYRLAGREEFVDDIVHTAFVKVGISWRSFRGEARLESWLMSIALNTAKDEFRRQSWRVAEVPAAVDNTAGEIEFEPRLAPRCDWDMDTLADETVADFRHAECVRRTLDELQCEHPKVYALIQWIVLNSPTTEELAAHLGVANGAARQRKSEYLGLMRRLCRKHCGTDECGWHAGS